MRDETLGSLRSAILACESYRSQVAAYYGLSFVESQAVSHLMVHGELGPTTLGSLIGLTPGSVTNLVQRLRAARWVTITAHPTDRRRSLVRLTSHGRAMLLDSYRWFSHALDGIDDADLPEVTRLLDLLAANLRRQADVVADLARGEAPPPWVTNGQPSDGQEVPSLMAKDAGRADRSR